MASPGGYTVIIPAYNRRSVLTRVLEGLARQDSPELVAQVVVVDDGSTDGTADAARAVALPWPTEVLEGRRGGPAAARNAGLEVATGRYALFLCDDVEPTPGLVGAHHRRRSGLDFPHAVVGAVQWAPEVRVTHLMRFVTRHYHFLSCFDAYREACELPIDLFFTANLSIERSLVAEAGGFDPGFSYGWEDTDLGERLGAGGLRLLYAPEALGLHHHEIALGSYCRRTEMVGRSAAYLVHKHPDKAEMVRAGRLPRPGSASWALRGLLRNRLTVPLLKAAATGLSALGLEAAAERLYFQILGYHYYRGMARGMRELTERPSTGEVNP